MNMKLQRKYFDLINMGIKKYEVRLLDEKRSKLRVGDTIQFTYMNYCVLTIITNLKIYNSFEQLLNEIDSFEIGLSRNKSKALKELYSIYPINNDHKFKVLAIKIKKVTAN